MAKKKKTKKKQYSDSTGFSKSEWFGVSRRNRKRKKRLKIEVQSDFDKQELDKLSYKDVGQSTT